MAESQTWLRQNHFLLRRLHSLTGIIPIGVFLLEHLLTNSLAFLGPEEFDKQVQWIQELHYLLALEILFIFAPLAFHGAYGVKIALEGRPNQNQYPYMDNWRYSLQRITAWITLVFVIVHLGHFRFGHYFGAHPYHAAEEVGGYFALTQQGFLMGLPLWLWIGFYFVGMTAAVFHFCNGIVTFCITWGITVGDYSRKLVGVGAGLLGILLFVWGVMALWALAVQAPGARDVPEPVVLASLLLGS